MENRRITADDIAFSEPPKPPRDHTYTEPLTEEKFEAILRRASITRLVDELSAMHHQDFHYPALNEELRQLCAAEYAYVKAQV